MWFFRSPEIAFGEDALDYLGEIQGQRALVVTDSNLVALGLVERIQARLLAAGLHVSVFSEVESNPSLETARRGAEAARVCEPDWIVALGGGSCIDAAKSIWIQYERPDLGPDEVAPVGRLGLRRKARLIAIPTTSGTGSEATWPFVLTDTAERCKISLGHPEDIPDIAIIDPALVGALPPQLTGDTGMDALTHAIEGYTSVWNNDFSDGLCLKAAQLVFEYLPRAWALGEKDPEAREKMHNAATLAGLGFSNSMAALAHGLGHSLGALFPVPHGRAVGLFLPYTIDYALRGDQPTRYADLARFLGWGAANEGEAALNLIRAVRELSLRVGQPTTLGETGIAIEDFEDALPKLVDNALNDSCLLLGSRLPDEQDVQRLFRCAFNGSPVDF